MTFDLRAHIVKVGGPGGGGGGSGGGGGGGGGGVCDDRDGFVFLSPFVMVMLH